MSYLGIVVSSVFAANALLVYGLGATPTFQREGRGALSSVLALTLLNAFAGVTLWCIRVLALAPLGLGSIDILVFALIAVPALKALTRTIPSGEGFAARLGAAADDMVVSCLVFGVALIVSRNSYSISEALVASAASGFGYWTAVVLLDSLRERLELSAVPAAFRGAPAMLISAGLMAMAFMGIDTVLVKNLAG